MTSQHSTTADFSSRYKFNGKELDRETGWYYYGARYYDPQVSTWLSVDPLAEKYIGFSPYNFTLGNPVRLIDPNGMSVDSFTKVSQKTPQLNLPFNLRPMIATGGPGDPPKVNTSSETAVGDGVTNLLDEVIINASVKTAKGTRYHFFNLQKQAEGKYGKAYVNISHFSVGYEGYRESGGKHGNASIYDLYVAGGFRLGTIDNNLSLDLNASMLKAEIIGDIGFYTGENNKYGYELGGEAGAYVAQGELTPSFTFLGYRFGITIGGSFGSAHIGGRTAVIYDAKSKQGEFSLMGHIGFGVGIKGGLSISNTNQEIHRKK